MANCVALGPEITKSLNDKAKEAQLLQREEATVRQKLFMDIHDLTKYKLYLQQHSANGANQDESVQNCKRCIDNLTPIITAQYQELIRKRQGLQIVLQECIERISLAQQEIANAHLREWKRRQTEAQVGAQFDETQLDKIQEMFEWLAEVTWNVRLVALLFQQGLPLPVNVQDPTVPRVEANVNILINTLNQLLGFLVTESFVVSKQPPPVVKKKTNFSVEVRLLLGDKLGIRLSLNEASVALYIISEEQAKQLKRNTMPVEEIMKSPAGVVLPLPVRKGRKDVGELFGPSVHFQFEEQQRYLLARFKEIKLDSITDEDRKCPKQKKSSNIAEAPVTVTQKKYCFLFASQFKVQDLTLKVWTLSLPVGVTVHGSQDWASHATIFWDNAFSVPDREPFDVRDAVPWIDFARCLKWKFRSLTGCERELSQQDLEYVAEKLFCKSLAECSSDLVSWNTFFKEDVGEGQHFSFWKWFFATTTLIRHIKDLWDDGIIMGFVSKQRGGELLKQQKYASFLIRFSDSQCGGVSISFMPTTENGALDSNAEPLHLTPFSYQDLQQMSLQDRISSCPQLQAIRYIYPDKDKEEVLKKWCQNSSHIQLGTSGYTKPHLIMWIPGAATAQSDALSPFSRCISPDDSTNSMMGDISPFNAADLELNLADFDIDVAALTQNLSFIGGADAADVRCLFPFRDARTADEAMAVDDSVDQKPNCS